LGYILGDFFTNSSGHPGCAQHLHAAPAKSHHLEAPIQIQVLANRLTQKERKKGFCSANKDNL
jgi:hypothetical protein